MAEQIPVSFSAHDGGVDDLSWGQYSIWDSMTNAGSSLPIGDRTPAPPGIAVEGAAGGRRRGCRRSGRRGRSDQAALPRP